MPILVCHNSTNSPAAKTRSLRPRWIYCGVLATTFPLRNGQRCSGRHEQARGLFAATIWNKKTRDQIRQRVAHDRIEVVHFHNTLPLISPSAYYGAREAGAAVVQTLHNFRLLCPGANLFRDGKACEKCVGHKLPLPGIVHKCYRDSRSASAAVATLISSHHALGTWQKAVDMYLAPTRFAFNKFVDGGWPADKMVVKPNFVDPDPGVGPGDGGYAIFVARLSSEKGLETLLQAWEKLDGAVPLKIVGDGPLASSVIEAQRRTPGIEWMGRLPLDAVYNAIGQASMLIFPSRCYETFGRVAAEAYAKGTPVVASRHGAPGDIVREGITGTLFEPGNGDALASAVKKMIADPAALAVLRKNARAEFIAKYTGDANHAMLMDAYAIAIRTARRDTKTFSHERARSLHERPRRDCES